MNPAVAGEGTVESEQTAPKQTQSLSEEILGLMRGQEPAAPEKEEEIPAEVPEQKEEELPLKQEPQEEEPEEGETDQQREAQVWPPSARKRVAEETEKRKRTQSRADKAESERDQLMGRVQQLEAQLEEASLPRPTREDPLADVFDLVALQKAKQNYENIKDIATRALEENRHDDEIELPVGRDRNGEMKYKAFPRRELVDMKLNSERALSDWVPQRERVLVARSQADALAQRVYPQFDENGGDNEWTGFVRWTLGQYPQLAKVPDIVMWIGHALHGREDTVARLKKEYLPNQAPKTETNSVANRILSEKKFKAAPAVSTGRVPSQSMPRRGADVEAARKTMQARPGDDDALEAYIDAKLFRGASRGYEKVS
jgi:hypothetical protein